MRGGFGKIIQKKAFWAKYNGECVEVSAKYIQKKAFWAKYNGECVEVSAKYIQKKHSGQNTMENA